MLPYLLLVIIAIAAQVVQSVAVPVPRELRRNDITYHCPAIDQWFKASRFWIQASTITGCMTLELNATNIYALNAIVKPNPRGHDYPNLVCSLSLNKCNWTYSPLDAVSSLDDDPRSCADGYKISSDVSCRSSPSKVPKAYEHQEGDENCGGDDDDSESKDSGGTDAGGAGEVHALKVGEGKSRKRRRSHDQRRRSS